MMVIIKQDDTFFGHAAVDRCFFINGQGSATENCMTSVCVSVKGQSLAVFSFFITFAGLVSPTTSHIIALKYFHCFTCHTC